MEEQPRFKKRNPFVAFILSIIAPGLGQFYNGQFKKAIIFFLIPIVCFSILRVFNLGIYFYAYASVMALNFLLRIYLSIDAIIVAVNNKEYRLKKYNTAGYYIGYAVVTMSTIIFIAATGFVGVQTFNVPTSGCSPSIQPGDYVVMDKKAYTLHEIKRGDIVAYNAGNGEVHTARVIGLPNDTLSIKDDIAIINGKPSQAIFVKHTKCDEVRVAEYTEVLPNGVQHSLYKYVDPRFGTGQKSDTTNIVVPGGSFFLMGDNRDGSLDSRYKGAIKKEDILGQMVYVLYRYQKNGKEKGLKLNIDLRN